MFWFIACLSTPEGSATCTTPVVVETMAACESMASAYKTTAESGYGPVRVRTRCLSEAEAAEPKP